MCTCSKTTILRKVPLKGLEKGIDATTGDSIKQNPVEAQQVRQKKQNFLGQKKYFF